MLTKTSLTIRLHPNDDVVIARQQLVSGTALLDENVKVSGLVPPGHKVATHAIPAGAPVKRYNQIIGFAKRAIAPGEHVHLHNLAMGEFARDYAFGAEAKPTQFVDPPASFMGIVDEAQNGPRILRRLVRRQRTTVNVLARMGEEDAGESVTTLVVLAHHDAPQTGLVFDQTLLMRLYERYPALIERIRELLRRADDG